MNALKRDRALDADEREALLAIGWTPSTGGSSCPDSSLLLAAEEGVLDDVVTERVRAHVTTCATCQLLAKDLALVLAEEPAVADVSRIREHIETGRRPRGSHLYIWLGGLAAAAAVTWFFLLPRNTPVAPAPETQLARATPPAPPTVFVVDRPAIPPGDVDLAVRGADSTRASVPNQIAAALDKADAGDVIAASADLSAIVRRNPSSRNAALALGAMQLRADLNAAAATTFERARTLKPDPATADEFDWFHSIALVRNGDKDLARTLLEGVCKRNGPRSAKACAGVAELNR
jgi:hypothetical protein